MVVPGCQSMQPLNSRLRQAAESSMYSSPVLQKLEQHVLVACLAETFSSSPALHCQRREKGIHAGRPRIGRLHRQPFWKKSKPW